MLDVVWLLIGLAILIVGAELLVRGASVLAKRFGVAPVIVGMTVVAFGTSTPELVVNLVAAFRGDSSIGFGNVVGSNISNIGLLLGMTALAYPLTVHPSIVTREIPMMLLASAVAVVLGLDRFTDGGDDRFTRGDGLTLLLLFSVFLYYTLADALQQQDSDFYFEDPGKSGVAPASTSGKRIAVLVVGGLLLLIAGGRMTVVGAVGLAAAVGISEVLIGLTVVAVGTSLPELATSFVAARRGQTDMAIGNIVGSNIFNLLFIWGLSAVITPSALPADGAIDLLVMTAFAAALLPMALVKRRLSRIDGGVLLVGYVIYIAWLAVR